MELSAKGAVFVRLHEGFRSKWYMDPVGIPTIGVGMTWRSTSFRAWWKKNKPGQPFARGATITKAEADAALIEMCRAEYGAAVNRFLGKAVPQHVFDAMVSVTYNCGPRCLRWNWAQLAKAGDYAAAAAKLRTTAVTAKGRRLAGLVRRRKEEALLLEKGIYTGVKGAASPKSKTDHILKRGAKGEYVRELQANLNALGHGPLVVDGDFGKATEKAVKAFQAAHQLKVDGWAGNRTQTAIGIALSAKAAAPKIREAEKKAETAETKVEKTKDAVVEAERKAKGRRLPEWLTGIGTALSGVMASIFGQNWMTVLAMVGAGIVVVALIVVFRAQIIAAFKDVREAVDA